MTRTVHPFPARMASELVEVELRASTAPLIVLDPMSGSGTVLRRALDRGHCALGCDVDPLAVRMARVWTRPIEESSIFEGYAQLCALVEANGTRDVALEWIDDDEETAAFIGYWFAPRQRRVLRRVAAALRELRSQDSSSLHGSVCDVLELALSRTIVTKDKGASLARDVSHSRPHRVSLSNDYDVLLGFDRAVGYLASVVSDLRSGVAADVRLADARRLGHIRTGAVDLVLTSPPYLNAIDYLRGHRLALVWMGYTMKDLRAIRGGSIGAERGLAVDDMSAEAWEVVRALGVERLNHKRLTGIVRRYATDLLAISKETSRVLAANGHAMFVVADSTIQGAVVRSARGLEVAAEIGGLSCMRRVSRELPAARRYLPIPSKGASTLALRMRTETVMYFGKAGCSRAQGQ